MERKRLFELAPHERSQSGLNAGIYSPDAHNQTYRHLEQMAREILQTGFPVIVDATFLKRADREPFKILANMPCRCPFIILHLHADKPTLHQRIIDRQKSEKDASEATRQVLEQQVQNSEELTHEEIASSWVINTEHPEAGSSVLQKLARQLMDNPDKICQD